LLVRRFGVFVVFLLAACNRTPPPAPIQKPNVLLITIDTLRADRLGSYGWTRARTPVLDALATRGTRFTRAYATAPITLTSHASMLTGRYPPGHGARHNGMAMSSDPPTLAGVLHEGGFETAAFVSAFPLDRRFGLTRGFDHYDDELPRGSDGKPLNERAGAVTVDRAIAWIRARPETARVFVWIHLFEPHAPYGDLPAEAGSHAMSGNAQSPEPRAQSPTSSASDRYDAEIATADREIGRLLKEWRSLQETLVIATADHGEAFGEHGEIGHSIFVYDTTLQVPLIISGPGVPAGRTIDETVALIDIAPTVTHWLDLARFDSDGASLRPLLEGIPIGSRILYAESFAPLLDFGWAPLRSLRRDGLKLIAAPRPELYDLQADAGETRNVIDARADVAREMTARVDRISGSDLPALSRVEGPRTAGGQPTAGPDRETASRLRALGYAGGGAASATGRPDPKDRVAIAARMAGVTSGELQGAAAERALSEIVRDDSGNAQAHMRLGFVLAESGRCPGAERHFKAAIASRIPSADAHLGLAMCMATRGAARDALATLEASRAVEPGNPVVEANIGLMLLDGDRVEAAIDPLSRAVRLDPGLHQARFALARALARLGRVPEALQHATELATRLPPDAPQRAEVERLISALR
jgi:choline-sulfatase